MLLQSAKNKQTSDHGLSTVDISFLYSMAAYYDFNEMVEKLYHITSKECQQTVNFYSYKFENHVYWQTRVIFAPV